MKPPTLAQITDLILQEDEVTVLELLELTTEDLVESFKHKIRERKSYLNHYYEDNFEEEKPLRKVTDSYRLGSKKTWEDAGFDLEKDSY